MEQKYIERALEVVREVRQLSFRMFDANQNIQAQTDRISDLTTNLQNTKTLQSDYKKATEELQARLEKIQRTLAELQ